MTHEIKNVACTVCGCVCDDLRVTVDENRIVSAAGACALADPWFLGQDSHQPAVVEIDGRATTLEAGLQRAVAILSAARAPLIYGLSRSSTDGQRAAVALADCIGATIDTTASLCHGPSILALQQVGEQTCSLGEVKNRADLVVYWGCDPASTHPRHMERYSASPVGEFIPGGRADRTIVVVDSQPTASSALADIFIPLAEGQAFEALWTLRSLVRGTSTDSDVLRGAPDPRLADLAARMRSCRFGIVFFGLGLSRTDLGHLNVSALLQLVRDLNDYTRFYARRMRVLGDVAGADCVLTWQTGYPFSVNLAAGYPRYNPGEFSAQDLLERREVDACLFLGSEGIASFSSDAVESMKSIPVIAIDHPNIVCPVPPAVRFTTAVYGIHLPGTAYRMDEVPIPLKGFLTSSYPSDADVLSQLLDRVKASSFRGAPL